MKTNWVSQDIRDQVVDFVRTWCKKSEIPVLTIIKLINISTSKFYNWEKRYSKATEHNGNIPRDFWIEDWEKETILEYYLDHPQEGYRRLSYMMLDDDIAAVSPSSVYRVLKDYGFMKRWSQKRSSKGNGFHEPDAPHQHWHIDVSYLNICGTFYYLCSILDGYSRYLVHWEIRHAMKSLDVEIIIQRAKEKFPEARPRIISDNGPQFIARDFKQFIKIIGMTHVRTSCNYPQSNGKKERWFRTLKSECIRPNTPLCLDDAKRVVDEFVAYYNGQRLHSAIGYIAPVDKLNGREQHIFNERELKLKQAQESRKLNQKNKKQQLISNEMALDDNNFGINYCYQQN